MSLIDRFRKKPDPKQTARTPQRGSTSTPARRNDDDSSFFTTPAVIDIGYSSTPATTPACSAPDVAASDSGCGVGD